MDWAGYPPLELDVDCGGEMHVVRWEEGALHLRDHDGGGEGVLAALGGAVPACVDVAEAWRRLGTAGGTPLWRCIASAVPPRSDISATIAPLWIERIESTAAFDKLLGADPTTRVARVRGMRRPAAGPRSMADLQRRHLEVIARSFPPEWLAVGVAPLLCDTESWLDLEESSRSWTRDALAVLVVHAVLTSDPLPPEPLAVLVDEWATPMADDETLVVPPCWFARVFARQAAVIDDSFILDLVPHPSGDGRFVAQRLSLSPQHRVTVQSTIAHLADDGWHLA